ncbi:Protein IMPACT-B [Taenia crassiceps]|uniref:Protein IMPACT-B n=1 Tax=Taenia crassiceps TaxID=6207 RepID=A0ABR4QNB5_9CEST
MLWYCDLPFWKAIPPKEPQNLTPDLQRDKRLELSNALNDLCKASIGSPVIYSMVETIRSFLEELSHETTSLDVEPHEMSDNEDCQFIPIMKPVYSVPSVREHLAARGRHLPIAQGVVCRQIYHGETISDRKSVFQAHCCEVASLAEVSAFISTILEDRKVAAASHNITAWYLQAKLKPDALKTSLVADYDDDGEAQAGGRLLHLISMSAREGVVVMVSRWYGGIHIGPDRFKHINNAANQLLIQQGLTKNAANSGTVQAKAKKHGKKKQ